MRKAVLVYGMILFLPLLFNSCQPAVDMNKEKEALISLINEEKKAYFERDTTLMATLWVHDSTARKIYMTQKGPVLFNGWAEVHAHDMGNAASEMWDDMEDGKIDFSDYEINIYHNTALVLCHAKGSFTLKGEDLKGEQERIQHMVKKDGKWKFDLMAIYNLPEEEESETAEEIQ
jgi:PBP1b-binding outer membrane lipoprotein LpoB